MSSTTSKSQWISNEFVSSLSAICYGTSYLLARTAATKVVPRQKAVAVTTNNETHSPKKEKQANPTHSFVIEVSHTAPKRRAPAKTLSLPAHLRRPPPRPH